MKQRILLIDALRGFALLGIILTHISGWFYGGTLSTEVLEKYQSDFASNMVFYFDTFFVARKFYAIFSFLFGVGFALQFVHKKDSDVYFIPRFMWRLVILLCIGFVHHIHWKGDILAIYAILGFFMMLFRNASDKVLWIAILFFILNVPVLLREIVIFNRTPVNSMVALKQKVKSHNSDDLTQSYNTLKKGTYTEVIIQNFKSLKLTAYYQLYSGRIFITFGFFLLGLWVGKKKVFEHLKENKSLIRNIMWVSITINLFLLSIIAIVNAPEVVHKMPSWFVIVEKFMFSYQALSMTIFYITACSLWLEKTYMDIVLVNLSAIGKTSLTNYLLQSTFGILLFYGIGFGLAGECSPAWCYVIGIGIFLIQIICSRLWLSRFKYGPAEWLWRSGTYFKWQ